MTDPALLDLPLPPELAAPDPGLTTWLDDLVRTAVDLADEAAIDVDDAVHQLHQEHPRWRCEDDGGAEWALRHVVRADQELQHLQAQANDWAARIQQWFDHRAKPLLATKAFMEGQLTRYALDRRDQDPKIKSLVLPSGAVRTTAHKPAVTVADEAEVLRWLHDQGGVLLQDVAPEQPRRVYVNPLRDHVQPVEVIDHAKLVLANTAEVVEWKAEDGARCPQVGDGWPTPDQATDLVARVEVLATHWEAQDQHGRPVPGAVVEPGRVTVKVVPAP